MSDLQWNSVPLSDEEKPQVSLDDLRELAADLDPDDFDEAVQEFLNELMQATDLTDLRRAATLLLQDEVDFSPELAAMGIEPDPGLITLLLATGADANALNPYGEAPLHLAARYGYTPIVDMLLAAGARLTLHNHAGRLAAELTNDPELKARLTPPSSTSPDFLMPGMAEEESAPHHGAHSCTCEDSDCHCHDHSCDCGCDHSH